MKSEKSILSEDLFEQAYDHPKFAALFIKTPFQCPQCSCEFVQKINEAILWCGHCYATFVKREDDAKFIAAA